MTQSEVGQKGLVSVQTGSQRLEEDINVKARRSDADATIGIGSLIFH